jgi:hypothetical protein
MKYIFFVFLLGIIGIGVSGCDEDCTDETNIDCPNYDPCYGVEKHILDFSISGDEYLGYNPMICDTIFTGSSATFRANLSDAISYEWKVGTDTRVWTNQSFGLSFPIQDSTYLINNPIPVTLIVEYEPNTVCFPNDDGRDTITKYVHFRSQWQADYYGKWQGYLNDDENNPYTIRIEAFKVPSSVLFYRIRVYNLYNEGDSCYYEFNKAYGFREFISYDQTDPKGCVQGDSKYWIGNMRTLVNTSSAPETINMEWVDWRYKDNLTGPCCDTVRYTFKGERF